MPVAAQQDAEIVERSHNACELDAINKEDREWVLALTNRIQEQILEILRAFRHFSYLSRPRRFAGHCAKVTSLCQACKPPLAASATSRTSCIKVIPLMRLSGRRFFCNAK